MRKVYNEIAQIGGNVITIHASGVGYREVAEVRSDGWSSLAQVIRLEGDRVSLQVFAGTRGIPTDAEVRFLGRRLQTPFTADLLGRVFTGGGRPRDGGPELDDDPIELTGTAGEPRQADHPAQDDPHRHPDDRRLQLPRRVAEAADLLGGRRAVQPAARPHRPQRRGRHHHPRRHGPQVRRLPVLPRHARRARSALALHPLHPHGRRPRRRVPARARHLPGRGRAVRPGGQARARAAHRHDQLRRRPQRGRHHHGADPVQPRLSGRPVQPARLALRAGRGLRGRRVGDHPGGDHHAGRRRDAPHPGQHRLHHRGAVLPSQRPHRAVRLAEPPEAAGQRAAPATTTARS